MFQKDYWSMSNEELERLAVKYHIEPKTYVEGTWQVLEVDRPRIISELIARDSTRQSNASLIISIISLLGTVAAIVISIIALKSN
jgi:hypothetical protein